MYKNIEINKILNTILVLDPSVFTLSDTQQNVEMMNIEIMYNHHIIKCNKCETTSFDITIIGDGYIATCCNCGEKNYNN
jgi:hypothetical protein